MTTEIGIGGLGMVSCLGLGVEQTAAAVRAGLRRRYPLPGLVTYDDEEMEAPVLAAPIPLLTSGFIQQARWSRMVVRAFRDLLRYAQIGPQKPVDWKHTPILWLLPNPSDSFSWPFDRIDTLLRRYLVEPISVELGLPLKTPPNGFFIDGLPQPTDIHTETAKLLMQGDISHVICIAVDSWVEPLALMPLINDHRLKSQESPAGMVPGEAAVVTLFQSAHDTRNGGAKTDATLLSVVHDRMTTAVRLPENWRNEQASQLAKKWADAIVRALKPLEGRPFQGDIYLDLNGEPWRAVAWGMTTNLLQAHGGIDFETCKEVIPSDSWGDVGVATPFAFLSLATRGYARRYASANRTLINAVSDCGDIHVMLIGA